VSSAAEELLAGWDDEEELVSEVSPPSLSEEEPEEEVPAVAPEEEEPEAQPEVEEDEEEEPGEDEGEEESAEEDAVEALAVAGFDTDDPVVRSILAQYQNDPVKALRAAADLRLVFDRQGTELGKTRQRVQELENQIVQSRLLAGQGVALSSEQAEWAEGAAASANPGAYVEQALQAGEFNLARAVCTYWARDDPFNAGRVGQLVDQLEGQALQPQMPTEAPTEDILEALFANVPGMREWEPQMVGVFNSLGPTHHLVQEARSNNIDTSMRALINIFEIAKASTASVQEQRAEIKKEARAKADGAKAKAAVTSGGNAPSRVTETPRADQEIMPGLTFGELENAFAEA
jgi:hypothetical protein